MPASRNTHLRYVKVAGARWNWTELKGYRSQGSLLEGGSVSKTQKEDNVEDSTFVVLLRRLVDDRAVLQAAQIEHAHTTIGAAANKDVDAVRTESDVVYLLVVRDQLRFGCECGNVPDCAGRVNAGCDNQAGRNRIPVEGGDRGSMFGRL
jgi:hypothetical protein